MPSSKGVYVNTLDVPAGPFNNGRRVLEVAAPAGFPRLAGWSIGVDSESADEPSLRISAQVQTGAPGSALDDSREVLGDYLYRAGRELRAPPLILPAPYDLEADERVFVFIKVHASVFLTARASFYLYFVDV